MPDAPSITALDCGWLRTQQRTLLTGGTHEIVEIPVPAWLIRHRRGDVVFDVGLHPSLATSDDNLGPMAKLFDPVLETGGTIAPRLTEHGVDPDGQLTVILSHGHFDHVGGLCELPNATLLVQADEWAAASEPGGGYDPSLTDLGHDVRRLDGEHDVFGDGTVVCIPTPGHTCGHQSLRISRDGRSQGDGVTILTADACYFAHTLDDAVLPPFGFDHELQRRSLGLLRAASRAGTRIIPGHDAEVFRALSS